MNPFRKNGVTLSELIAVVVIFFVVFILAIEMYTYFGKSYKILVVYIQSYVKGRETIDFISKDCRNAIRVMDEYAGYISQDDSLVLRLPSIDSSGEIVDINSAFDYVIYWMSGNELWKTVIPGSLSARPATDGVFKKSIESFNITSNGIPLSGISHKTSITNLTLRASIAEVVMGHEARITPGTNVKLMNYDWEYMR